MSANDATHSDTDIRRERRHLTPDEFAKLLSAARAGDTLHGMTGPHRELLYLTAAYTCLRASELASLTDDSFKLGDEPTVTVESANSKHRRGDVLPLHPQLANRLTEWLRKRLFTSSGDCIPISQRPPGGVLWPGDWAQNRREASMVRHDLEVCGIPYLDDAGRQFDFHALRHQFISMLAEAGVHPKTAQELARHSDINLTLGKYTHVRLSDLSAGVSSLPDVAAPDAAQTTGTDGEPDNAPSSVTQIVTVTPDIHCSSLTSIDTPDGGETEAGDESGDASEPLEKQAEMPDVRPITVVEKSNCERQDSNLHGFPHWILNPARLPIPPLSLISESPHQEELVNVFDSCQLDVEESDKFSTSLHYDDNQEQSQV